MQLSRITALALLLCFPACSLFEGADSDRRYSSDHQYQGGAAGMSMDSPDSMRANEDAMGGGMATSTSMESMENMQGMSDEMGYEGSMMDHSSSWDSDDLYCHACIKQGEEPGRDTCSVCRASYARTHRGN